MHGGRIVRSLCRKRRCNLKIAQRDRVPVGVARVGGVGGEEKKLEEAWMAAPDLSNLSAKALYRAMERK